ncbi:hypothetical protein [Lactococcus protaetiae]|uniref:Uncharacterized protein n=1 Tax=Lactococcus protaetiae TaxID=2592653 RepID=A0A514Z5R5_9LACT|nr:hypothetical protein [Lactococcus protaetiae]MCL2114136.1 hypothetical protein [Streptococcaceae bacterium]QDK69934.1 hypothetical protein FLP15_00570 [Lactococcus protaetiae]
MIDFFNDMKKLLSELTEEIDTLKLNVERVQTEAKKAERTGQDIQRKVTEFQVATQPKIDKINELVEKINKKAD